MGSAIISPLLTERAPLHLDPTHRLVWVLARPLQDVALIRSVGSGGFPILHWAVLISERGCGLRRMRSLFESLQDWPRDVQHFPMGTIQELRYDKVGAKTTRNGGIFSTFDFLQKFPKSSIAYVGMTSFTNEEIDDLAQRIWLQRSWDYRVLKSNCQHFASFLIKVLTGQELYPKTISELIKSFVPFSLQPAPLLRSTSSSVPRHPQVRWWTSSSEFSPDPAPTQPPPMSAGSGIGRLQLDGFRSILAAGEREYMDSLGLGDPRLLQDYFLITEEQVSNRVTRAVCVLYREVFLLCRYHASSSLRPWPAGAQAGAMPEESEKLFVYAYLYPRHIEDVTLTRVGFRLQCKGVWLGEDCATEWLVLDFQASNGIPGDGIADLWMHSLLAFRAPYTHEIGTIFDRLPLDRGYVTEIDLQIDLKIYRTVVKYPLASINALALYDLVRSRVKSWRQRSETDDWTLKYKTRGGDLLPVTPNFPNDTDGGWREFFSGFFFVDF